MKDHGDCSVSTSVKQSFLRSQNVVQRIVFVARRIVESADENSVVPPALLSELKGLIVEADHAGIHGYAYVDEKSSIRTG